MEFMRKLDDYANLSIHDRVSMETHALDCERCRGELEFYRSIVDVAAGLPPVEPPPDLLEKVNKRIDDMPKFVKGFDKAVNNFKNYRVQYATAAACVAVGLVVGLNSEFIQSKLDPSTEDGVISTNTKVDDTGKGLHDYEIDDTEPGTEQDERVVADNGTAAAPENTENQAAADMSSSNRAASLPVTTPRPVQTPKSNAANTASVPAASSSSRKTSQVSTPTASGSAQASLPRTTPTRTNTQAQRVTAAPQIQAEPDPVAEQPASDEAAYTQAPPEQTDTAAKNRYTIARGNYYIPETAQAPVEVTETPNTVGDTEIAGERYQIAMGSYELSEAEKKPLSQNKLIVNGADINEIIRFMNSSWIKGTDGGYTATVEAFTNFLAKLDAAGIYYNYIQLSEPSGEIYFVLLAN